MNLQELIQSHGRTIVDVRTPAEFSSGGIQESINIPLQELPKRLEEIKKLKTPLILCCASGNRSGQAQNFLSQHGIQDVINGGSWLDVEYYLTK